MGAERQAHADDGGEGDAFGISVAMERFRRDHRAPNTETFRGAAYCSALRTAPETQTEKLVASDGTEFNQFGWSVALRARRR
jgi:hypothetical protein